MGNVVNDIEKEIQKDRTVAPQMDSGPSTISEGRVVTIPLPEARSYLERTLREIRKFKSELAFRQDIHDGNVGYPPQAVLYANNTPTVKGAKISGLGSIVNDDVYDTLAYGAGKTWIHKDQLAGYSLLTRSQVMVFVLQKLLNFHRDIHHAPESCPSVATSVYWVIWMPWVKQLRQ